MSLSLLVEVVAAGWPTFHIWFVCHFFWSNSLFCSYLTRYPTSNIKACSSSTLAIWYYLMLWWRGGVYSVVSGACCYCLWLQFGGGQLRITLVDHSCPLEAIRLVAFATAIAAALFIARVVVVVVVSVIVECIGGRNDGILEWHILLPVTA